MACTCGHTIGQHDLRAGGLLGCYIYGCNCIDYQTQELTPDDELDTEERWYALHDGWVGPH